MEKQYVLIVFSFLSRFNFKMIFVGFLVSFGLSCVLLSCKGKGYFPLWSLCPARAGGENIFKNVL